LKKFLSTYLSPLIGLTLLTLAVFVIRDELSQYDSEDILKYLGTLPFDQIFSAWVLTVLSYLVQTWYDVLAFRTIRQPLGYWKISLAAFTGTAISNSLAPAMLTGSSVRFRFYSNWGITLPQITTVVIFGNLTFWLGLIAISGIIFLLEPMAVPALLHMPFLSVRPVGVLFLAAIAAYLAWSGLWTKPLKIRTWEFTFPPLKISVAQILVSAFDWVLAGGVLYALLPPQIPFFAFLGVFLLAQIAGMVGQVPGGLGVFETVIVLMCTPEIPLPSLLAALLIYRGVYYILPLALAALFLGNAEIMLRRNILKRIFSVASGWVGSVAPYFLAVTTFIGGCVLIFSGATEAVEERLAWLNDFLPLPVIEMSHFLGSIIGVGLLILARGLYRRLDAAYHLTAALLTAGILFSLLKGFDFEEAILLTIMLGGLWLGRRHFYRKASLFSQPFTFSWFFAIAVILIGSLWLGILSSENFEYSDSLWWQFELLGDVPRAMRTTVGALIVSICGGLFILLRTPRVKDPELSRSDLERCVPIVGRSKDTLANLALLGDKLFLFNDKGNAFIMYCIVGRSWIALGDPVGPEEERDKMIWQFHELCDRHGAWTVFYQVNRSNLHLYLDLGLSTIKLGEEAYVPLKTFSLEGNVHKGIRYSHNKLARLGYTLEIVPSSMVKAMENEFRNISDQWLDYKDTREKKFSLGYFEPDYLQYFPMAVIKKDQRIIAFANLWLGADHQEVSFDLMRHVPDAPGGIMDYFIIELLLWGKQKGYTWFNLGMAPFSGFENRPLAPIWNRLGSLIFLHGEYVYNFQGLHKFKDKFGPKWEHKYLATPGGLILPRVLINLTSLISQGLKGVVAK
jgi:phosphatidylglycerol lysyltransferase